MLRFEMKRMVFMMVGGNNTHPFSRPLFVDGWERDETQ